MSRNTIARLIIIFEICHFIPTQGKMVTQSSRIVSGIGNSIQATAYKRLNCQLG